MPFVPVDSTVLVECRMTLQDQKVENTLWVNFPTEPNVAVMNALAADILDWWISDYATLCSDNVVLREVVCTYQGTNTGAQVSLPAPGGTNGNLTGPQLPNNNSLTVSFRTANRGRSFRGRNYIVGLIIGSVVDNNAVPGYVNAVTDAYEKLLPGGGALTAGTWVVASRFSGVDADDKPIPRAAGVVTPITSVLVVDSTIDSQRRRLPGRGK